MAITNFMVRDVGQYLISVTLSTHECGTEITIEMELTNHLEL